MAKEELTLSGKISGVEVTEPPDDGQERKWKVRATIKVDIGQKYPASISTFEQDDIDAANLSNGKKVSLKYTPNDKYKNLVKGSLKKEGEEGYVAPDKVENQQTLNKAPQSTPDKSDTSGTKDNYWAKKFEFEVKTHYERQRSIVMQNSYTQANKLTENTLKAIELKLIDTKDLDINQIIGGKALREAAHTIATDILEVECSAYKIHIKKEPVKKEGDITLEEAKQIEENVEKAGKEEEAPKQPNNDKDGFAKAPDIDASKKE